MPVMWFGTFEKPTWINVPKSGADVSPQGWSANATLLGGGAMQRNSWGSHKEYTFAWSNFAARQAAQLMKSYSDGTFGRGLIYFHDPLTYGINVLPAHYADPSMAINYEAPTLVPDVQPTSVATSTATGNNNLPIQTVTYSIASAGIANSVPVYVPIPPGMDLVLGAMYSRTGTGGVWATPVNQAGADQTPVLLTQVGVNYTNTHSDVFPAGSYKGVRLWVGKSTTAASSVTITAMSARLIPTGGYSNNDMTLWYGGQGNSGCRFVGKPTYTNQSAIGGGQIGYAVSLRETGAWEF